MPPPPPKLLQYAPQLIYKQEETTLSVDFGLEKHRMLSVLLAMIGNSKARWGAESVLS
jgi:hypothetical protein